MKKQTLVRAGLATAVAGALSLGLVSPALGDAAPGTSDAVAVGSDTVQYVADFLADGTTGGSIGWNANNPKYRLFTFDATGDASGRASYVANSGTALASTIVPRQGKAPMVRPNGSGAGITALLNDSNHYFDFVRSSRCPKASEQSDSRATAFGGIHVYRIATDGMQIAVNSSGTTSADTNAPAGIGKADLIKIYNGTYKTWGDLKAGTADPNLSSWTPAAPDHAIVPIIPQTGSGTRGDFLADLGLNDATIAANTHVKVSEEHDPTAISNLAAGFYDDNNNGVADAGESYDRKDAIAPFSTGRDKLIDSGYFGTTPAPNLVFLENATGAYNLARNLYILARENDVNSTTEWQTGTGVNKVKKLFGPSGSLVGVAAAAKYTAAGVTRAYFDNGVSSTCPNA